MVRSNNTGDINRNIKDVFGFLLIVPDIIPKNIINI